MKSKKFSIPIYNGNLIVISVDDNWDKVNEKYNTLITDSFDGVVFRVDKKDYSTDYVVAFKGDPKRHVIAHESVHLVNMIFYDRMINLDIINDEPQAYLTGWIFEQIEKVTFNNI